MADIVQSATNTQSDTSPVPGAVILPAFTQLDSRLLHELFSRTNSSVGNPVFITIDFDNIQRDLSQNSDSEVGLAILDIRDFDSIPSTKIISTYSFAS